LSWLQYARTLRYLRPVQMYGLARNRFLRYFPVGPAAIQGARVSERVQSPLVPFLPAQRAHRSTRAGVQEQGMSVDVSADVVIVGGGLPACVVPENWLYEGSKQGPVPGGLCLDRSPP
jgi:hypothetical protein